jgi:hypothetical protein
MNMIRIKLKQKIVKIKDSNRLLDINVRMI